MEEKPDDKQSWRAEAIAALLSAGAGAGIGWLTWQLTGNIAVGIGISGPMALVASNLLRKGKT